MVSIKNEGFTDSKTEKYRGILHIPTYCQKYRVIILISTVTKYSRVQDNYSGQRNIQTISCRKLLTMSKHGKVVGVWKLFLDILLIADVYVDDSLLKIAQQS